MALGASDEPITQRGVFGILRPRHCAASNNAARGALVSLAMIGTLKTVLWMGARPVPVMVSLCDYRHVQPLRF